MADDEAAVGVGEMRTLDLAAGTDDIGGWSDSEQASARTDDSHLAREADLASASVAVQARGGGAALPRPAAPAAMAAPTQYLTGTDSNRHQLMLFLLISDNQAEQIPFEGKLDCVRALLELGADVRGRDRLGNSALHAAAQAGNHEIATALLGVDAGPGSALVDDLSFSGRTALHFAATGGHFSVVQLLCEAGCTLDLEDRNQTSAERSAELSGHHDCVNEIRRARSIRGMQVASEDNLELLQMRAEIQDLTRRSSQLVESIASKEEFIADKLKNSQEYVARSEQIAQMLTSATTTEQLDKLGRESDQCVALAEESARTIITSRAEAAGLRAELARTQADLMDATRRIADIDARAQLGEAARKAEHGFQQKDTEARLFELQVKQLRRELVRHTEQNQELRTFIGRGYADWLHKTATERAELEAEYAAVKGRLADLEGALPRGLDLIDSYDSRVGKLRAQLADVNASVAAALNAAAEGETRATMAEENAAEVQKEIAVADKASRFAIAGKNSADARAAEYQKQAELAEQRYANASKELTKVRAYVQNVEMRLKGALKKIEVMERDVVKLKLIDAAKVKAEEVARVEMARADGLRSERNDLERQLQVVSERVRELEGSFNADQSDWWQRKLAHSQRWTKRRERLYEANHSVVQVRDTARVDEQWQALNDLTRAVDVSLRRTCGQLKLRTCAVQTDTTWYNDHPIAATDSEGERHAWMELVRKKEAETVAEHHRCLQLEKRLRTLEAQLNIAQENESRLRAFKKQVGPNREADKQKMFALESQVDRLSRILGDPNPALRSAHQMLRASEKTEADALALAAQTHLAEATAAAEAARSATPIELPPLQAEHFVFQNTEIFVDAVEPHSQAARFGVPLGFILKKVKHSKGEPDISKLRFQDVVSLLKAGLRWSPLEITVEEAPCDQDMMKTGHSPAATVDLLPEQAQTATISATPTLPAIVGPNSRANILRQLAAATNERDQKLVTAEEIDTDEISVADNGGGALVVHRQRDQRAGAKTTRPASSESSSDRGLHLRASSCHSPQITLPQIQSSEAVVHVNRSSGLDSRFAIAALARAEDGRQREAARNVELQQRCEALSTDLVVQTDLVSAMQDELSRAESLAADGMHTVAKERQRSQASEQRNALAASLLREVHESALSVVKEMKAVSQLQLQTILKSTKDPPKQQEVSDYAVIQLGMDGDILQELGWIAQVAVATTLASGWRVSRNPKDGSQLIFLNEINGRVERTHPMQQHCQQLHLHLHRWSGLSERVSSLLAKSNGGASGESHDMRVRESA